MKSAGGSGFEKSAGCSISFEILGKVDAMSLDSPGSRTSQSNAEERSHPRDEYSATLVAQLKAQADEKKSKRKPKSTSMCIPPAIYETFKAAAKKQETSMAEILRLSLGSFLSELVKLNPSATTSGNPSVNEKVAREIASRLVVRDNFVGKGYYFFPVRLPLKTHHMLRRAAVKHNTTMKLIMVTVLESVAPYLLTHPWRQYELFDKK